MLKFGGMEISIDNRTNALEMVPRFAHVALHHVCFLTRSLTELDAHVKVSGWALCSCRLVVPIPSVKHNGAFALARGGSPLQFEHHCISSRSK